ncbi:MAG: MFS transporter [Chloroflexota bacterium]|nr:MFS transporter [Chloroflexota bacterium]
MGPRARLLLLAALGAGACLVGVELMITAVALPAILADLSDWTQLRQASWILNGYLLAYVATMPLAGRAADRFGTPVLFVAALALFAVGSALAGAAQDLNQLIVARVVQGIGGGALVPLATAGASHLFDGHARARALGVVGALTFLGMALGPFVGAAVLEQLDLSSVLATRGLGGSVVADLAAPAWRWIFYLGVPLAVLAALYVWAAGPGWESRGHGTKLDLAGAFLFTLAVGSGLLALTWLGTDSSRTEGLVLSLAIVCLGAAALAVRHFRRTPDPFLELRFFREPSFSGAVLLSLLTGYALATAIVGGAVFVDRVRYGGPDEQRLALGALALAMSLGALASGIALRWLGPALVSVGGLALGVAGLGVLATARAGSSLIHLALGLGLFGLGFGLTVTPRSAAAVEALGRRSFGLASAAVTVARMLGMAVGLAVLTALGSNRIEALSVVLTDAAARDGVLPPVLRGRTLQDGLVIEALERWAADQAAGILAGLFALAAGVMVVALLPAVAMRRPASRTPSVQTGSQPHGEAASDDDTKAALAL